MLAQLQSAWLSFPASAQAENAGVWVGIISGGLTALVVIVTFGTWLYRRFVQSLVDKAVDKVMGQLRSNGGDTARAGDRLLRIEERTRAIMARLDIPDPTPTEHELRQVD